MDIFGALTSGVSSGISPRGIPSNAPQPNASAGGNGNGSGNGSGPNMGNAGVQNFGDQGLGDPSHSGGTATGAQSNGGQGGQQNKSPLDDFSTLFKLPKDATDPMADFEKPLFQVSTSAKEFVDAVSQRDFSQSVPEELITKALSGDGASFRQAINHALRTQFLQLSSFVQSMVEQGVKTYHGRSSAAMPHMFKDLASKSALAETLPNATHQGVQPLFEGLQAQMQKAYPNDTPTQLAQRVRSYLMAVAQGITPPSDTTARDPVTGKPLQGGQPNGGAAEDDFSNFFR